MPTESRRILTVSLEDQGVDRWEPPAIVERYQPLDVDESRRLNHHNPRVARNKEGRGNDRDIRAWLLDHKRRHPCLVCGEADIATLDFHHRDPQSKSFAIAEYRGRELAEVRDEVAKCDVLCANCHRKRHNNGRRF